MRCAWPDCKQQVRRRASGEVIYCHQHWQALPSAQRESLRLAHNFRMDRGQVGPWTEAVFDAQSYAAELGAWRRTQVTGEGPF